MTNAKELSAFVHNNNVCRKCAKVRGKWCYTWDICTARIMEIIAYNMILKGVY